MAVSAHQGKNHAIRNSQVDVIADNPEGTMDRFTDGLKKVLSAHKNAGAVTHRRQHGLRKAPKR